MLDVAVSGASGRMGSEVIEEIEQRNGVRLVAGFDKDKKRKNPEDFEKFANEIDVLVDFTVPEACIFFARKCRENGIPFVTGTTNLSEENINELREISSDIPVLRASNFSRGINVIREILSQITSDLEDFDIEILEEHHSGKTDSPSGTAKTLAEDISEETEVSRTVEGRSGDSPREENEIGISAIRAGGIKGLHEVIFASEEEQIRFSHSSSSRKVFAFGALDACEWLVNREQGYYDFRDVLGD